MHPPSIETDGLSVKAMGIDLVYLPRLTRWVDRYGAQALKKVLTEPEQEYCLSSAKPELLIKRLGARIAAKESVVKALGRGFSLLGYPEGVGWRTIEVAHGPLNRQPTLRLYGRALEAAQHQNITQWHISLTHDGDYAMAMVMGMSNE